MPSKPKSPTRSRGRDRPVPFLWGDVVSLMETHSIRPTHGDSPDPDVQTVKTAIRRWLIHHDLPPDEDYAVPVYWVHQWLMSGLTVARLRPVDSRDAASASRVLLSALNTPGNGLEIVQQRCRQYTA